MKIKTFNIGEYAIGGRVQVERLGNGTYRVRCLDWDTRKLVHDALCSDLNDLQSHLEQEVTSCYWADEIYNHFKK